MDRSVLHTETENDRNVYFVANVPFEIVPEGFILALKNRDFSVMEYYAKCKDYNDSEFYWNLMGLTKSGKPVIFIWGTFDKLEKLMHITRISMHPHWQSIKKDFMEQIIKTIDKYSKQVGANLVFTITDKSDSYLRKLNKLIRKSDSVVLEIIEGINYD